MATINGNNNSNTLVGGDDNDALNGLGGDDTLSGGYGADVLRGGAGNDTLSGYTVGYYQTWDDGAVDRLFGEDGNDYLALATGDFGDGGAGNDVLVTSGAGTFSGGAGNDILRVSDAVNITGSTISGIERLEADNGYYGVYLAASQFNSFATIAGIGTSTGVHFELTAGGTATLNLASTVSRITLDGSAATENLTLAASSSAAVTYTGGDGNVTLQARGGDDALSGGYGADVLRGGAGNDTLSGYTVGFNHTFDDGAVDRLFGEDGNDYLALGAGDFGDGGAGNDRIVAGGAAVLNGGDGNDTLASSRDNDNLTGGAGSDTASYENVSGVVVDLQISAAQNTGGGGFDTLVSIENLTGSVRDDTLQGNAGDNVLRGLGGNDYLGGRGGRDTASYAGAGAVVIDLNIAGQQNTGGAGLDTLVSIEDLIGSSNDDTLFGTGGANTIEGGAGNDSLNGRGGTDTASYTGAGAAVTVNLALAGAQNTFGAGVDTLIGFENLRGSDFADTLGGNASANLLQGGLGSDTLRGQDGADRLEGGDGNDILDGGLGADAMVGGAGNDTYIVDNAGDTLIESAASSGGTADHVRVGFAWTLADGFERLTLTGTAAVNGTGNAAANVLTGNAGANVLRGLAGNDTLNGGDGADRLVGGVGADVLNGGAGGDRFVFETLADSPLASPDTIVAFDAPGGTAGDLIDLSAIDANGSGAGNPAFTFNSRAQGGIWLETVGSDTFVYGNTDADSVAEFAIRIVDGPTQHGAYGLGDFVL